MKTLALVKPKPFNAFRDKYLAAVMMVAALFITSIVSAQADSTKYSGINGYGFRYKRHTVDSVQLIPLSSSPHTPYRAGGIRYNPGDSTLQLWTGHQWNSIVTGGNGIDTAYALNDSTITIETPNQTFFVVLKGQNISNTALTANGDYQQDWANHWFFLNNLKALDINSSRADPNHTNNLKVFRFYSDSTADATAMQLAWGLKDQSNSATDSLHFEINSNKDYTYLTHWVAKQQKYVELDLRPDFFYPAIYINASGNSKNGSYQFGSDVALLQPNDSIQMLAVPATTAPKILGFRSISGNVGTVVAMDLPAGGSATLSNAGSGYRLVKTPSGAIKTWFFGYGTTGDSTTNTDALTIKADTSTTNHLVTQSDLNDSASALRAAIGSGGSGEANTASNQGSGVGLYKTKSGVDLQFKSITSDATITVTPNTNDVNVKADTSYLKGVYLPLYLPGNKTINQAGNNITFAGGGKVKGDSLSLKKTIHPFMAADSAVGFGHSIMAGSSASGPDSNFLTRVARSHGLFVSNRGVPSTSMHDAVSAQMSWINLGHNAYTVYMGSLNDVRNTNILSGANRATINYIISGLKAVWMNHMAKVVVGASDGSLTRSGSWSTGWPANTEGGKVSNGAYTSTVGNYIEYTFTDSSVGFQMMGVATAGGTVTVAIDGSTVETFSSNNQFDNSGGHSFAPLPKFYTGLTNTSHTIRVTNTSGGLMVIDYFTRLRDAATAPPVCFFHEPHLDATGYSGGQASDAAIDTINVKYDSLRNALPGPWKIRTIVARTNTRYIATTSSGLSSDHIHPNDTGHGQIALSERDAISSVIGSDSGTIQYGDDGFLYVDAKKVAYQNSVGLQDVINNNPVLSTPAYVTGSVIEFNGFSKIGLNFLKVGSTSALAHGTLGVQGPLGGLFAGDRNGSDTTNGFVLYTGSAGLRFWNTWNGSDLVKIDTSARTWFRNNFTNNVFANATATVHIGGNDFGIAGHAPLKIGKSTWLGTPEAYAWENDSLYIGWTNGAGLRDTLATRGWARSNIAGGGVTSLNSQTGAVTITGGTGITTSTLSGDITIAVDVNNSTLPHTIATYFTDAANSGTSETDLFSTTTGANTLSSNGQTLYFDYTVNVSDITATADLAIYFGSTQIGNTGALTVSATGAWRVTGSITRATSTTARATVAINSPGASTASYTNETDLTSQNFATTNVVKITGQAGGAGGGSGDITAKMGKILYQP